MQTFMNSIPGYRVFEYLLVIYPNEELSGRVIKVKEHFASVYKTDLAKHGKPYLTLAHFVQYEMMEERILNRLRLIAMGQPAFKTELKDFGSFPSHTIYINVTTKVPYQGLVKKIRSETQRLMKMDDENKPNFILEPYITIARKLKPWQYEKGWLEYSNKHFSGRFIVDQMVLMKRPKGEMKYQVAQRFSFENMPVVTKQGELFL